MTGEKKVKRKQAYTVLCHNIYVDGVKAFKGETVMLFADEAKEILDGDKAAGRAPRVGK